MKIGISSWSCPWAIGMAGRPLPTRPLDAIALLEKAAAAGAEALQIADNLPLAAMDAGTLRRLASAANAAGISLEAGTIGLDPGNLLRHLDIAGTLGAKLVRTLPHDGSDRPDLQEALRRLLAVRRQYEDAGVLLAIENHDFYPGEWLRSLVDAAGSPMIGVCLDAVNNLGQGESFREVLACLGPRTLNFHCKDYAITRKPTMLGFDVTGRPAGGGMLDLPSARRALRDDITWVIESWLPWQGDIASTVATEDDWLARGVRNLKAFRETTA
jgi:sugar phosphate isomerase/epimerase